MDVLKKGMEGNLLNAAAELEPALVLYLGPDFVRLFHNMDDFPK